MKPLNIDNYITEVTAWLKEYAQKAGLKGFVLGVSGGVDSAVVSTLCARTGMPVLCLEMPIHQDPSHTARSTRHIAWLKAQFPEVSSANIDLTATFDVMRNALHANANDSVEKMNLADANTRSRLRMATIYYYANSVGLIVAGTGNKVEDFGIGFCTKGGDSQIDVSPLGNISKTEVWAVAAALGVNQEIIDAKPTDGLWAGSPSDEDQIGASYPELEWAMEFCSDHYIGFDNCTIDKGVAAVARFETENIERKEQVMRIYMTRNRANHHKMVPAPIFNTLSCREAATTPA